MNGQFELGAVTPQRYFFGIAVILGLLFATVGDDDAGDSVLLYYLTWQLQTVIPMALFVACHLLLARSSFIAGLNPWLQLLLSGGLGALLFTPLNLGLDIVLMQGDDLSGQTMAAALIGELLSMAPPAMISWTAINAPWVLGFRFESGHSAAALLTDQEDTTQGSEPAESPEPPFMSLIPQAQRGTLIFLKAELHYLSVYTSQGHALLLYNLRDAIAELPDESGFQCHRSYWVSRDQVLSLDKRGRQGVLKMSDDSKVPVSRNYLGKVSSLLAS